MKARFSHWLPKRLNVDAITLYPFVLFAAPKEEVPARIIRHEQEHIDQVREVGVCRFYISYLLFYFAFRLSGLSHFESYWEIPWESKARLAERIK